MARNMQSTSFGRRLLPLLCFALLPMVAMHCASSAASEYEETRKVVEDEPKQKEVSPEDMKRAQREVALALRMIGDELNQKHMRGKATQQGDDPVTPVHQQIGKQLGAAGSELERKAKLRRANGCPVIVQDVAKEIERAMSSLYSSFMGDIFSSLMNRVIVPPGLVFDLRNVNRMASGLFAHREDKENNTPGNGEDDVGDDAGTAVTEVADAAVSPAVAEDGTTDDVTAAIEEAAEAAAAGALAEDGEVDDVGSVADAIVEVAKENGTTDDRADDAGTVVAEAAAAAAPTEDGTADEEQAESVTSEKELEDAVVDLLAPSGLDGFKKGIEKYKQFVAKESTN